MAVHQIVELIDNVLDGGLIRGGGELALCVIVRLIVLDYDCGFAGWLAATVEFL